MTFLTSSAVCICEGETALSQRYGRWHIPEAPVAWASVSKLLTGATARVLIDQGVVDDDTPICDLLGVAAGSITVRELIEHRSKLARVLPEQEKDFTAPYSGWTADSFDQRVISRLDSLIGLEPGYSNLGYAVLARIIERVTELPILEAVRQLVSIPSGLERDSLTNADNSSPIARAYSLRGTPVNGWEVSGPWIGAGGFAMTPLDMATFISRSIAPGGVLDPRREPHSWEGIVPLYAHDGALRQSGSLVVINPDTGRVAVAHSLGGVPGAGDHLAESAMKKVMRAVRRENNNE
ncbi:serine hydrolase domain-containing protein [Lysinibacter sp. HNR]|uniref:serine hydrolase domain-containing protein n=1 Tax=Lysinibacter sp. HNR TaxID=3031408 RepID=UPI002435E4DB|nr:serine hydrolase domain-containing protein [Lysinibacter sp. HNR]WGD37466.1 serine hydrolase [Lysinibacter sp. HNR]